MKTTGLKATVVLLVAMVTAGLAVAGWGGGRGRFGPGPGPAVQDNTDEQGPWYQHGPGRGGPDEEIGPGGPRRGFRGPDAMPSRMRRQRPGRGWGDGRGLRARMGRGGRGWPQGAGRDYQRGDICPYCQGTGRRPVALQRRPMRDNWRQEFRGSRVGEGFRRGKGSQGRRPWNRPGRGLEDENIGPRGWDYERRPMIRRRALEDNQGRGFRPGRGGRGVWRGEEVAPDDQGRGFRRPYREDRPSPEQRRDVGREDHPRLRRGPGGPGGPVEPPVEKAPEIEPPVAPEANSPVEDQPVSEEL